MSHILKTALATSHKIASSKIFNLNAGQHQIQPTSIGTGFAVGDSGKAHFVRYEKRGNEETYKEIFFDKEVLNLLVGGKLANLSPSGLAEEVKKGINGLSMNQIYDTFLKFYQESKKSPSLFLHINFGDINLIVNNGSVAIVRMNQLNLVKIDQIYKSAKQFPITVGRAPDDLVKAVQIQK